MEGNRVHDLGRACIIGANGVFAERAAPRSIAIALRDQAL